MRPLIALSVLVLFCASAQAQQKKEAGTDHRPDQRADAAHHVEDHSFARDQKIDEVGGGEPVLYSVERASERDHYAEPSGDRATDAGNKRSQHGPASVNDSTVPMMRVARPCQYQSCVCIISVATWAP